MWECAHSRRWVYSIKAGRVAPMMDRLKIHNLSFENSLNHNIAKTIDFELWEPFNSLAIESSSHRKPTIYLFFYIKSFGHNDILRIMVYIGTGKTTTLLELCKIFGYFWFFLYEKMSLNLNYTIIISADFLEEQEVEILTSLTEPLRTKNTKNRLNLKKISLRYVLPISQGLFLQTELLLKFPGYKCILRSSTLISHTLLGKTHKTTTVLPSLH